MHNLHLGRRSVKDGTKTKFPKAGDTLCRCFANIIVNSKFRSLSYLQSLMVTYTEACVLSRMWQKLERIDKTILKIRATRISKIRITWGCFVWLFREDKKSLFKNGQISLKTQQIDCYAKYRFSSSVVYSRYKSP